MTKQRQVFFFIGTLSKGGAERAVSRLTQSLAPDIERHIILYGTQTRIDYPVQGELHYIDQTKKNSVLNKFLTIFRRLRNLNRLKRAYPDAVFVSLLEYPNLINVLSGFAERTVLSVRNHMSTKHRRGPRAWFWNTLIRLTYHKASRIIVVSAEIQQDLISHYHLPAEKITWIPNGYDLQQIQQAAQAAIPAALAPVFTGPVISTMGRMNLQKGQWHLLRAFPTILARHPSARLLILGEGQYLSALQRLAEELKLREQVVFAGFQSNPHALIARSQVFVLPSLHEGFPNALAEAMACGVPVVSADCPSGPREILAPSETTSRELAYGVQPARFGLLYPLDSAIIWSAETPLTPAETKLAELVLYLLDHPAAHQEYVRLALSRIQDYDLPSITRAWETVLFPA